MDRYMLSKELTENGNTVYVVADLLTYDTYSYASYERAVSCIHGLRTIISNKKLCVYKAENALTELLNWCEEESRTRKNTAEIIEELEHLKSIIERE